MSNDDKQNGVQTSTNGHTTNGHANGDASDSPLSEDDLPLTKTSKAASARNGKRKKPVISDSSSDDDVPLASSPAKQTASAAVAMPGAAKATTVRATSKNGKKAGATKQEVSHDDNDSKPSKRAKPPRKKAKKKADTDSSDDDKPPAKKPTSRKRKVVAESDANVSSDDDKPIAKKARTKKVKEEHKDDSISAPAPSSTSKAAPASTANVASTAKGRKKKAKEEEEEDKDIYRWWEQNANDDGSVKWTTLEHNGVFFPPPYEPLPTDIKMKYNGQPAKLHPEAEEVAGFYAALIETEHAQDDTFNNNFFTDFLKILERFPSTDGKKIKEFEKCDFRPMYDYFEIEKARKKALSAAEKKELKKVRDEAELKYTLCTLDGRKEKVGNFRVEPPGLFRGRGKHPKKGSLKYRVRPEDITINIGKKAPVPVPNMPGKWKAVQHDNTVTWLATWTENINQNHKYVFLAAGSSLKGQSDMNKFEKARELKNYVDKIRANYTADLRSKVMATRQRATAMYFIDRLALRAGNEKGDDEADTVGCCSLRCEHLTLQMNGEDHEVVFDFLGKDSIRYYNTVTVDAQIFKNIKIFKDNKNDEDNIFDRVNTTMLNKHLNSEMKGLTAKVFRTFNASITFQRLLDEAPLEGLSMQQKLNAYNAANREVAILCNHQRSAPKTHEQSMEKMKEKLRGLKYDRMKFRHALFEVDSTYERKTGYREDESDIDDDFIKSWEASLKEKERQKAEKKFAKDNEKLVADGKEELDNSVLQGRLTAVDDEFTRLATERGTKRASKREKNVEKLTNSITKLTERIKTFKLQMEDRDEGKEVSLGTSKINYLDPRITAAWCQINEVPIEKLFSKTLLTKFPWALEVDKEWKF